MSTGVQTALGKFVWHDHTSSDVEAAKSFYTELFGWELETWTGAGMNYPMIKAAGRSHGGFGEAQGGAPPHWLGHVLVEDVDDTVETVRSAGGNVIADPFDIPEIGRMAVIADPQGAALSAFQATSEPDSPPAEGVFVWDELLTTDVEGAKSFYHEVFGWTSQDTEMGEMTYTMFKRAGDVNVAGCMPRPEGVQSPPFWMVYIATNDVDATASRAEELGGKVMKEAFDVPEVGRIAVLLDPTGAAFGLFAPAAQ
jgi:predicted enzyme related to lactoylglutathione lyase